MKFIDSAPISIPLSNPKVRYGNTFSISDIYLVAPGSDQFYRDIPSGSSNVSVFKQDFSIEDLSLVWNVVDPSNGFIYTEPSDVINNQYISGFDVTVYQNSGTLNGLAVTTGRTEVFRRQGIKGNNFSYSITGLRTGRNYSIDVVLTDFTGNQSSGLITSINPEPIFAVISTGIASGFFELSYSGYTGEFGQQENNQLGRVDLYNFTGLSSGESGFFSQESGFLSTSQRIGTGFNDTARLELSPGFNNYVMMVASDQYSTGSISGFFKPQVYATGVGFSGLSGNIEAPKLIEYPIAVNPLTGYRISGGEALYYSFAPNYNTGSSLMYTSYGITGTGITTGSVSGYDGSIFLDSGILYDTSYNTYNTGFQYVYDNSLSLQSGLFTGTTIDTQLYTGSGITGSGTIGSGAGDYWKSDSPKYTGTISGSTTGGNYDYAYFDSSDSRIGCLSLVEISGGVSPIEGVYSMPKNQPNSYDIKYRQGDNFSKSYEQASTYLNTLGEMPAVIVNNSQWQKIKSINTGVGWIGLRRNKVAVLTGLFSEDFKNQEYFLNTNFGTAIQSGFQTVNATGNIEENELLVSNIGENWAWTNSSGNHIYKYAGSGYGKVRTSEILIDIKRKSDEYLITGAKIRADAPMPQLENLTTVINNSGVADVSFSYNLKDQYYNEADNTSEGSGGLFYQNYDIMKIALYSGSGSSFGLVDENLFSINSNTTIFEGNTEYQSDITFSGAITKEQPNYFKLAPYDSIASGFVSETGIAITVRSSSQYITQSLDPQFSASSKVVNVTFPLFSQAQSPNITQTLAYTGTIGTPTYIAGMVSGSPTESGTTIILNAVPPATGYILYIGVN